MPETSFGPEMQKPLGRIRRVAVALVRLAASLKFTFVLAALVAAALACGAYLERTYGLEFAQWHVYATRWLIGLLIALAANVAAVALVRFPRRWSEVGRVIAPVGVVVLLAGFIQTLIQGLEGRLYLWPGEAVQTALLPNRSQITLLSPEGSGVHSTELGFSPGPVDWADDRPLDFGEVDGKGIKVLRFYRYARFQTEWVADATGLGTPAIQVAVPDAQTGSVSERWCVPAPSDAPAVKGQPQVTLLQGSVASMHDEFLKPPALKPGSRGVLSAHYKDRVYPIPVDGNTGKQVPLGDGGLSVEIVAYFANAKLEKREFSSEGTEPKNPMLQLRVHVPGEKQPISEIAFANHPFLSFGAIHRKQDCPVKFWFHHPDVKPRSGAEFLQTPDGKLYCRVVVDGAYQSRGEVKPGDRIALAADREITLLRHVPHARQDLTFVPIELAPGETTDAEAAAHVELITAERTERFWLRRNDDRLGVRRFQTSGKPLIVTFGYEWRPLGFSVKLIQFQKEADPESPGDTSYVSQVQLIEPTQDPQVVSADNPAREISTNCPLQYGTFTFYQTGSLQLPGNVDLSVLRVTSDPGRLLKYVGGAMLCAGILLMLGLGIMGRGRRALGSEAVRESAAT
jgi:hypothetical protein